MEARSPGDRGVAFMEACRYQGMAFTNTCMGSLPSCRRTPPPSAWRPAAHEGIFTPHGLRPPQPAHALPLAWMLGSHGGMTACVQSGLS